MGVIHAILMTPSLRLKNHAAQRRVEYVCTAWTLLKIYRIKSCLDSPFLIQVFKNIIKIFL